MLNSPKLRQRSRHDRCHSRLPIPLVSFAVRDTIAVGIGVMLVFRMAKVLRACVCSC